MEASLKWKKAYKNTSRIKTHNNVGSLGVFDNLFIYSVYMKYAIYS